MGEREAVGLHDTVFLIFQRQSFGRGDRFDPQELWLGVGFRFGVVDGWRVGGGGVGGPIALNRGVRFRRNC